MKMATQTTGCHTPLKDNHNASLPISRLPAEILLEIFFIHRSSALSHALSMMRLSWIRVTHVCRHWRTVGLSCSALWSTISFINRESVEVMLKRSGNAPLMIDFAGWPSDLDVLNDTLQAVLSQVRRVRSLRLEYVGEAVVQAVLSRIEMAGNQLESLSLISGPDFLDFQYATDIDSFRKHCSILKSLRLVICCIPWDRLPVAETLTSLHLTGPSAAISHRPSAASFLCSLREVHHLRALDLHGYLPLEAYPPSSEPVFTFRNLQTLRLVDPSACITNFFRAFKIGNAEAVDITSKDPLPGTEARDLQHLLQGLKRSWTLLQRRSTPGQRLIPVDSLTVSEDCGHGRAAFYMWIYDLDPGSTPYPEWNLPIEVFTQCFPQLLQAVLVQLDPSKLTTLHISCMLAWDEDLYGKLFGTVPRVTELTLQRNPSHITKTILKSLVSNDWPYRSSRGIFPTLSTLELWQTDLESQNPNGVYHYLSALLKARHIPTLRISECSNFEQEHANALKQLLHTQVVWDGRAGWDSEEDEEDEENEEDEVDEEDEEDETDSSGTDDDE